MSLLVTLTPSSNRNRFSSSIFKEYGSRSTLWPRSALKPRIWYFLAPTLSVVLALKLSVMTPPLKTKQYRRFRRACGRRRAFVRATQAACHDPAAEAFVAVIEDRVLAGRHRPRGAAQDHV